MKRKAMISLISGMMVLLTVSGCNPRFQEENSKTEKRMSDSANQEITLFDLTKGKNGRAPLITLNSGDEMPVLGLGTYSLKNEVCVNSVEAAIQSGFRKIDTAFIYDNEASVGEGIRKSGVPREEIFVTTKLYMNQYENAEAAINEALECMELDYIDLMLLHHPGSHDIEAYKVMEKAVEEGKLHTIGLSNYYIEEMEEFLPQISIKPALVQNEIHPYYQENEVIEYLHKEGIVVEAWYPLGGRGHTRELIQDDVISAIAEKHKKSSVQVILRWHLQKNVVAIPGSSNPDHIKENIAIFDFELSEDEMKQINALDRNEKHDWY
ncbi:aldo/keto reductase [Candidatus Enterococcus ferrettii]|uniref:NADP-dependent oxidoreductase domain-containing protein n=1 Tax=Candidatus Enterococcus ferrettii TaxID=2815324 RepID=A0ABV0EP21_9ENTE|nr:aldo/keto reductase [Enterococcus sp. 665A]MBO1342911.1 aldo/keto reductase [Enterococcus sp. 665A]